MTMYYDLLYSKVMKIVSRSGVAGLIGYSMSPQSIESIPFIVNSTPFIRRLSEIRNWPSDSAEPLSLVPKVNGPEYPIQLNLAGGPPNWAIRAEKALEFVPEYDVNLNACSLFENPLIVWGAAAMEGFFSNEEMSSVVDFMAMAFGRISDRPDALKLVGQADVIASLIAEFLIEGRGEDDHIIEALQRFVTLCGHCGAAFQVCDRKGMPLTSLGNFESGISSRSGICWSEPYGEWPARHSTPVIDLISTQTMPPNNLRWTPGPHEVDLLRPGYVGRFGWGEGATC
jgi:hypothetical protein